MNFRLSRCGFFEEAPSVIPCYTNGANPRGLQFYRRERFSECRRAARMPHACLSVMDDMIKPRDIASDSPLKNDGSFFWGGISPLSRTYLNEWSHGKLDRYSQWQATGTGTGGATGGGTGIRPGWSLGSSLQGEATCSWIPGMHIQCIHMYSMYSHGVFCSMDPSYPNTLLYNVWCTTISSSMKHCRSPRSPNDMLAIGVKSLWLWSPDNGESGRRLVDNEHANNQMWHTLDPHETIWTKDGTHIICACWCKYKSTDIIV